MAISGSDTHNEVVDVTDPQRRPHVLMVVANPGTSTTLGWPVGFWAAELFHPYYEFTQRRYDVTVASPEGGRRFYSGRKVAELVIAALGD
jgi:putative intracellular protease/amidase